MAGSPWPPDRAFLPQNDWLHVIMSDCMGWRPLQVLLDISEGRHGALALLLLGALARGAHPRPNARPPSAVLAALLPPAAPQAPVLRLCALLQARLWFTRMAARPFGTRRGGIGASDRCILGCMSYWGI